MKPRLEPAPPTEEDFEVCCLVAYRFSFGDHVRWNALAHVTREAAKRDADLMFQAQELAQFGNAAISIYGIECRGWSL